MAALLPHLTEAQKEQFKKVLKKGFIYQKFHHTCGYKGNCYREVKGKWKWISLEEYFKKFILPN